MLIPKVLITGGPCSGKTTGIKRLTAFLKSKGIRVFVVQVPSCCGASTTTILYLLPYTIGTKFTTDLPVLWTNVGTRKVSGSRLSIFLIKSAILFTGTKLLLMFLYD